MSLIHSLRAIRPCSAVTSGGSPAKPSTSTYSDLLREVPKVVCEALRAAPASGNEAFGVEDSSAAPVDDRERDNSRTSTLTYLRSQ